MELRKSLSLSPNGSIYDFDADILTSVDDAIESTQAKINKLRRISSRVGHYLEWKDAYPFSEAQVAAANVATLQTTTNVGIHQNQLGVAEQAVPYEAILNNSMVANSQQILLAGLFSHANFLDVIQNFTLYEPVDGRVIKKIACYQQFRAPAYRRR